MPVSYCDTAMHRCIIPSLANGESFTGLNFCSFRGFSENRESFSFASCSKYKSGLLPRKSIYCGYRKILAQQKFPHLQYSNILIERSSIPMLHYSQAGFYSLSRHNYDKKSTFQHFYLHHDIRSYRDINFHDI